jgi:hypothetical protein
VNDILTAEGQAWLAAATEGGNAPAIEPPAPDGETPISDTPPTVHPSLDAVGRLTHDKAARIEERNNYEVTGYVMTHRALAKKCVIDMAAVRWFPNVPEFMLIMTGQKVTPGPGTPPLGYADIAELPTPVATAVPIIASAPSRPILTAPPSARMLGSTEEALDELARDLGIVQNESIPHNAGWFVPGKANAYASSFDAIKALAYHLKSGGTVYYPAPAAVATAITETAKAAPPKKVMEPAPDAPQGALF